MVALKTNEFKIVEAGANHNCALTNKYLECWGINDMGQVVVPWMF